MFRDLYGQGYLIYFLKTCLIKFKRNFYIKQLSFILNQKKKKYTDFQNQT